MGKKMQDIIEKLDNVESDIRFIKERIEDSILSENDVESLNEAEEDLKKERTSRL